MFNILPKLSVSPAINDLVDLCPNSWCSNFEAIFFRCTTFFDSDFYLVFTKNACLLYAVCGRVTTRFFL